MEDVLINAAVVVLVLVVAYIVWKIDPDFARHSSRALFMRDLSKKLENTKDHDTKATP